MRVLVGMPWKLDWEISGFAKHIILCFKAISDLSVDVNLLCLGPSIKNPNFSVSPVPVKTTPITDVFGRCILSTNSKIKYMTTIFNKHSSCFR